MSTATALRPLRQSDDARGFVLSVDVTGIEAPPAELLRVLQTLAELTAEWLPGARARAALTTPDGPVRAVPSAATRAFRERLDAVTATPDIVVEPQSRTVVLPSGTVTLTARETALLVHLARAGERAVGRTELLASVWGDRPLDDDSRTIDVHVRRLRDKTGLADLVATVRGRGYRLDPRYSVRIAD